MLSSLSGKVFAKDLQSFSVTADPKEVRLWLVVLLFQSQVQDFMLIITELYAALVGQSSSLLGSLYMVAFPSSISTPSPSMV